MKSKRSGKRLQRSRVSQKVNAKQCSEELNRLLGEFPERMRETEAEIKDTLGPDGMRKVLGIASDLDPVTLATIAANLVPKTYSHPREERQALVRAAMLQSESRELAKNGPTIFDVPDGALIPVMRFRNHPAKRKLDAINRLPEPKQRLSARAKFITRQDRSGRAESDLFEMLGEWAKEQGESDISAISAYKELYKDLLSSSEMYDVLDALCIICLRDSFAEWKAESKSKKAASAAKKGRTLKS